MLYNNIDKLIASAMKEQKKDELTFTDLLRRKFVEC